MPVIHWWHRGALRWLLCYPWRCGIPAGFVSTTYLLRSGVYCADCVVLALRHEGCEFTSRYLPFLVPAYGLDAVLVGWHPSQLCYLAGNIINYTQEVLGDLSVMGPEDRNGVCAREERVITF
jgi:hypothetical protein